MKYNSVVCAVSLTSVAFSSNALRCVGRTLGGLQRGCVMLCLLAPVANGIAQAGIISQYAFTGATLNRTATTVATNVTAGDITDAPKVNNNATVVLARTTGVGYSTEPVLSVARANFNESSVPENVYFTFNIAPNTGYELDLGSLTFNAARGGGATPRTYDVRTSLDGFATSLTGIVELLTARPTFTPVSVNLSGAQFQNLTSPLTFQVRIFTPTVSQNIDFDDITINGEVAPEPTAISLFALAGCWLFQRWRRGFRLS